MQSSKTEARRTTREIMIYCEESAIEEAGATASIVSGK